MLERPLDTKVRPCLLLPPNARLRYSILSNSQTNSKNVFGLREAMSETILMFTAWDGTNHETAQIPNEIATTLNISFPFCSNGVSTKPILKPNTRRKAQEKQPQKIRNEM